MTASGNNTYELTGGSTGDFNWLLIPYSTAAPNASRRYNIGGSLKYRVGNESLNIDLQPALITVDPDPSLRIHYFWEKYIEADDPFTPDIIEPSTPFTVGVAVNNAGYGTASNVRLASDQPDIVDKERGLKIDFRLLGSSLGNQQRESDLNINFGDLEPMTTKVARWWLITTLQGKFQKYSAKVSNINALGDEELNLIDELRVHELIANVKLFNVQPDDDFDDVLDFLTNDVEDILNLPDHVYSSDDLNAIPVEIGQVDHISSHSEEICADGICNDELILSINVTTSDNDSWTHFKVETEAGDEIGIDYYTRVTSLKKICETGSNELPFENAWIKTIPRGDPRKTFHYVNIFDFAASNEDCFYEIETCGKSSNSLCKDKSGIELIDPYEFIRKAVNGCLIDPPNTPANIVSNFTFDNSIFETGDSVEYVCIDNGFTFYSICMENGNWSEISDTCNDLPSTTPTANVTTTTIMNVTTSTTSSVTTTSTISNITTAIANGTNGTSTTANVMSTATNATTPTTANATASTTTNVITTETHVTTSSTTNATTPTTTNAKTSTTTNVITTATNVTTPSTTNATSSDTTNVMTTATNVTTSSTTNVTTSTTTNIMTTASNITTPTTTNATTSATTNVMTTATNVTTPSTTNATTSTTTNAATTTTEATVWCDEVGGFLELTNDKHCVTICSPRYMNDRNYPAGKIVKWTVKPNQNCTGGTKVTFIGSIFHLPRSAKCKEDDFVRFNQKISSKKDKVLQKCGEWSPEDEPDRENFRLVHVSNNIRVTFNSKKKQKKNGRGFMAQLCAIDCPSE